MASNVSDIIFVTINDCAPVPWWKNTDKKQYMLPIYNNTNDFIGIESIEVPDSLFDTSLSLSWFPSSAFVYIELISEKAVYMPDYRLVINFMDDKYPSQVIHVNLHSDM